MIYFLNDYSQGAHPKVLEKMIQTNEEWNTGYGLDVHCKNVESILREKLGKENCHVHLMIGGTPTNVITIAASLRPYECVISARSGHIYVHETGAVEATGHRVLTVEGVDGKLRPEDIDKAMKEFDDEHTAKPKMVYISNSTEIGSIYRKTELEALSAKCKEYGLYLYMDGARLGSALTCEDNDLTLKDIADNVDAFYIGGTKNGAMFGEALVILNDEINDHFRWMIKRNCGMLAKGQLLGIQFEALLEDDLLLQIGQHENDMAKLIRDGIESAGYGFFSSAKTNQIFPVLPNTLIAKLRENFAFYDWAVVDEYHTAIRLVTSWGTTKEDAEAFVNALK
ncbi:MAG: beta-eliminating lyase-related protein [Schaedlerella sp.]|nr:beta-eliminating lyase-related protein [Schaedlerella sp.]